MSVQAMAWVLERSEAQAGDRLVLLALANHAGNDAMVCWPAVGTIAREARMSERGTRYALRRLERAGRITSRAGAGPRGTTLYTIERTAEVDAPRRADVPPAEFAVGQDDGASVSQVAPEPLRTVMDDDDAGAPASAVFAVLASVPEWRAALATGADAACLALMASNRDVPWLELAGEVVASRLDPAPRSLTTNSPRQALDLRLRDHRSGRRGGDGEVRPRPARSARRSSFDHYRGMAARFEAEEDRP